MNIRIGQIPKYRINHLLQDRKKNLIVNCTWKVSLTDRCFFWVQSKQYYRHFQHFCIFLTVVDCYGIVQYTLVFTKAPMGRDHSVILDREFIYIVCYGLHYTMCTTKSSPWIKYFTNFFFIIIYLGINLETAYTFEHCSKLLLSLKNQTAFIDYFSFSLFKLNSFK